MKIDKDTKLFGSFAKTAGSKGCEFFNNAFEKHNINAIYKSFSVDNIASACIGAEALKMSGFAVAAPYKTQVSAYINKNASNTLSVNTVVRNEEGKLIGYNTDYNGAKTIIQKWLKKYDHFKRIYILGKGGLSISVQHAAKDIGDLEYIIITKENWGILKDLKNCLIYNCTPEDVSYLSKDNIFIDCRIGTSGGDELYQLQAKAQFKLYTGIDYV